MPAFNVSRDHSGDAWFRLGRLDVTSTMLLVLLGAVGVVFSAFAPSLVDAGEFIPRKIIAGEAWRVVTWPFVDQISLWSVLTLVMLWYFGTELEKHVGRSRMAGLYAGMWATLSVVTFVIGLVFAPEAAMASLNTIQFIVLLLWIAEYPRRPFFFGIPAWVVGTVLVAVQVLVLIAARNIAGLISLLLAFAVCAALARGAGLLTDATWLPGRPAAVKAAPRAARPGRAPRPPKATPRQEQRRMTDTERLDELLEKISAEGIHSLTPAERKELEKLRQRRRTR